MEVARRGYQVPLVGGNGQAALGIADPGGLQWMVNQVGDSGSLRVYVGPGDVEGALGTADADRSNNGMELLLGDYHPQGR